MSLARSTFYDAPAPTSPGELVLQIGAICDEFECYGYRRVGAALRHQRVVVNSKKLRRLSIHPASSTWHVCSGLVILAALVRVLLRSEAVWDGDHHRVERPGASFNDVARRHEVSRGLLWTWRRQVREGVLAPEPMPMFMPVQITADVPSTDRLAISSPHPILGKAAPAEADRIEIALPDGTCIRVGADVGLVALRRVVTAVRR